MFDAHLDTRTLILLTTNRTLLSRQEVLTLVIAVIPISLSECLGSLMRYVSSGIRISSLLICFKDLLGYRLLGGAPK
jgi:hypothetical protein